MSKENPTALENFLWDVGDWIDRHMGWIVAVLLGALLLLGHTANADAFDDPNRFVEAWVDEVPVVEEEFCEEPYEGTFEPEGEVENMAFTVHWFDTAEELRVDIGYEYDRLIKAASMCEFKPDKNIGYCDLWLVRPTRVDGDTTLSIGHEVLHGLLGAYHDE